MNEKQHLKWFGKVVKKTETTLSEKLNMTMKYHYSVWRPKPIWRVPLREWLEHPDNNKDEMFDRRLIEGLVRGPVSLFDAMTRNEGEENGRI